jgi:hypothetical protein
VQSEVVRLLREIEETYTAAKNGLSGLAEGTAKHAFVTAKMERLEEHRVSLTRLVGAQRAMELIMHVSDQMHESLSTS